MSFNKYQKVDPLEIRPRFRILAQATNTELLEQVLAKSKEDDTIYAVKSYTTHVDIFINRKEQTFWSPVLHVNFDKDMGKTDTDTMIRCLVGPKQSNWLMFIFIYLLLSVLGTFSGIYGLVQYFTFNKPTLWLWTFPVSAVIILAIYLFVKMGQKAKHHQIVHLVRFLYSSLEGFDIERQQE